MCFKLCVSVRSQILGRGKDSSGTREKLGDATHVEIESNTKSIKPRTIIVVSKVIFLCAIDDLIN